jgi:inosine/xanthosine triphosphatase
VKVIVASKNPVKIGAASEAFAVVFPEASIDVSGVEVDSGVGDQPDTDAKTREGARARALSAHDAEPDADFWVGLEGGVEVLDGQLMAFAWMAIKGRKSDISEARSATLPLPPAVKELVDAGVELGEANDRVFSTVNSKQGLADGRPIHAREHLRADTYYCADSVRQPPLSAVRTGRQLAPCGTTADRPAPISPRIRAPARSPSGITLARRLPKRVPALSK